MTMEPDLPALEFIAKVFRDRRGGSDWRVERQHEDGAFDVAVFGGPDARERALRHAAAEYGKFAEVNYAPAD